MKTLLWTVVIVFLLWMAIDLAPMLVHSLNSLADNLQKTTDGLDKTITNLEVYTARRERELAVEKAQLPAASEMSPEVPRDSSRVERFKQIPKLAEKKRSFWIKELGLPTKSEDPVAGVPPGGIDCWRTGGVDMIVTWLKDKRPLGMMLSATKGQPALTTEEIDALKQYFARFRPTASDAPTGVLVVGINKEP
jgi:hypothetical protein